MKGETKMPIDQRMMSPFTKAKYLSEPNYKRYITIVNYLYRQHEYYYSPPSTTREIYNYMKKNDDMGFFEDYTEKMLDTDLKALEEWGNVLSHADNGKVASIQEYNKARLRFQCTQETIEIERMMETMDNKLNQIKGSLDASKVNSLSNLILQFKKQNVQQPLDKEGRKELYQLWSDIIEKFDSLRKEASDYLGIIQSKNMEESMKDKKISVFRTKFTEYLTDFIISLQNHTYIIENAVKKIEEDGILKWAIEEIVLFQKDKPNLDTPLKDDELKEAYQMQWGGVKKWFVFDEFGERFVSYLMKQTDETISKFTKYLQQLSESERQAKNRNKEFLHLVDLFENEADMDRCYRNFGALTNIEKPRHLISKIEKEVLVDKSLLEQEAMEKKVLKELKKNPVYKKKQMAITTITKENQEAMEVFRQQKELEERQLEEFTSRGTVVLAELEPIEPVILHALLNWISKSLGEKKKQGKTETGVTYTVRKRSEDLIKLYSSDGILMMPDYIIEFKG